MVNLNVIIVNVKAPRVNVKAPTINVKPPTGSNSNKKALAANEKHSK